MMDKIFVCSQLRESETYTEEEHIVDTQLYCRYVSTHHHGAPFAPHLLYTQFLDDTVDEERKAGIDSGIAFMNVCDTCFVFINSTRTVSEGMKHEIAYAMDHNIPVRAFYSDHGRIYEVHEKVERWRKDGIL